MWPAVIKSIPDVALERMHRYGHVYGSYFGRQPVMTITDHQLIKQMMIKDFPLFINRAKVNIYHEVFSRNLVLSEDEDWKRGRTITSPSFTTGKLRGMGPMMNRCVEKLFTYLDGNIDQGSGVIDTKQVIAGFTIDVVAITNFATETNANGNRTGEDSFIKHGLNMFRINPLRMASIFLFPRPVNDFLNIKTLPNPTSFEFFQKLVREIVRQRKLSKASHKNDLVQLMIDAEVDENNLSNTDFDNLTASIDDGETNAIES